MVKLVRFSGRSVSKKRDGIVHRMGSCIGEEG